MNRLHCAIAAAIAGICLTLSTPDADAQVVLDGRPEPGCPYGYYDYAPYACAPYGYYGPEWFIAGLFVGAGPWFHGPADFRGHVDNRFDVRRGYRGPLPNRGDHPFDHFRGNEIRDGRGHSGRKR